MNYWDSIEERLPVGKITWPEGVRMPILVAFDYQAEVGDWTFPDGTPNYGQITEASYGGRVAIWRILDVLHKHGVKATFNTCGVTAERYPQSAKAIVEGGHEIAGHTYTHRPQYQLSEAEEREEIVRTVQAIEHITGQRIVGWRCPIVQPGANTIRLLIEEGFLWDGNFLNYDLPYMLDVPGTGSLLEIPYTFSTDDFPFIYGAVRQDFGGFPGPRNTMADLFQIQKDEFDVLYQESATMPRMFVFQNHPLVMGRAHRILYFDRLLEHMRSHEGVWFCTFREMTEFWKQHYDTKSDPDQAIRALGFRSTSSI
ncbi:MAG TPA: polysaccharide deacetylase family protein [Candidatus Nitrosotalea sp.]|nr:polysaccharide deacetylase family protein [Candidatus Nitrosotalea sp.]